MGTMDRRTEPPLTHNRYRMRIRWATELGEDRTFARWFFLPHVDTHHQDRNFGT
jgi:hypothetical protein